jgi:hypothetical protein
MGNSQQPTAWERTLQTHTLNFPSDNQPRFRHEQWRKVFENQVSKSLLNAFIAADDPLFSMPLGENREEWKVWLSREGVWERYRTLGQVAVLEGEELEVCCFSVTTSFGSDRFCLFMRALVLTDVFTLQKTRKVFDDAINGDDVEENEKGEVAMHGTTYAYWTTKIPAEGKKEVFAVTRPGAEGAENAPTN